MWMIFVNIISGMLPALDCLHVEAVTKKGFSLTNTGDPVGKEKCIQPQ